MSEELASWAFEGDTVENWAFYKNAFSAEECKEIIKLGKTLKLIDGEVNREDDINYRKSKIAWMHANRETEWIYRRLTDICTLMNKQFFQFDVFGFVESLQFTKYTAPSGYYGQHTDKILHGYVRKLSISIQLTESSKYTGGDLHLFLSSKPMPAEREIGALNMFPSYMLHEVTPVTKGTRYSLVGWITGKQFK